MFYLSNKTVNFFFRKVGVGIGRDIPFLCNIKSPLCFISFDLPTNFTIVRKSVGIDRIIPIYNDENGDLEKLRLTQSYPVNSWLSPGEYPLDTQIEKLFKPKNWF